jgi:hypothetical protein
MPIQAHANNFLAPEPHIVARLKEALADLRPQVHVLTASDLALVKEEKPADACGACDLEWLSRRGRITPRWPSCNPGSHLVDCFRRQERSHSQNWRGRSFEAGELAARAGAALMGFRPPNVAGPMRLSPSPSAGHSAGFVYLPLAFVVETVFKSELLL